MRLYYVRADQHGGENADLYVWAGSPGQAAAMWHDYALSQDWIFHYAKPLWVDEVPTGNHVAPAIVEWDKITRHEIT